MKKDQLALHGGKPVRQKPFPPYPIITEEDVDAIKNVVSSGELSTFHSSFRGGEKINEFENTFARYFGVENAIAVNSGTAALHIALAAAGVGPGDEVIVPPYTFTATATSVLMHNAIPVFADVNAETFNIQPNAIEKKITKHTKAIIPVHLLGNPAPMKAIMAIAKKHKLIVIEDCAQAPGAMIKNQYVGTFGDLGCFSFQETKNLMTGEGGMTITNDPDLAHRCRLVRNHGEAFLDRTKPRAYIANILGWNYRMTELEAALGISQFSRFNKYNAIRNKNAEHLNKHLEFTHITPQRIIAGGKHIYSLYGLSVDTKKLGITKAALLEALNAEGIPFSGGYPHPLYMNPIFRHMTVYGEEGCPFNCHFYKGKVNYAAGICPVSEDLCDNRVIWTDVIRPPAGIRDMKDVVKAFEKIFANIKALK